jgi:hypothetical protein
VPGQQLPFRRIQFRLPVRPHRRMRVILHLLPRFPSDPAASVVVLPPPPDKRLLSRGWTRTASLNSKPNHRRTYPRLKRGPANNPTRRCWPGSLSYASQSGV